MTDSERWSEEVEVSRELNPELLASLAKLADRRDYLEVFTERDFKGASQRLPAGAEVSYGTQHLKVNGGVGNDTICSLRLPSDGGPYGWGYTVVLYADDNCQGASRQYRGDCAYVGDDFANKASSIRIYAMRE